MCRHSPALSGSNFQTPAVGQFVSIRKNIMKIEIGDLKPDNFQDRFPDEFSVFSHFEIALGIPHSLFLITTVKENGKSNACFQSWSSFSGDCGGYFAITPLLHKTHTYHNILRTKEFCINFMSAQYFDACYKTVFDNLDDTDEIAAGGFTPEPASCIRVPRIQEAFLSLECALHSNIDLSGKGISSLIIGKVLSAAMDSGYLNGSAKKYGQDGFMYYLYDLHDFASGDQGERKVASLNILRKA
jgi:flavin reductase (DIM6/NTAB) family NADH-FMN oxidoreductase RutF